MNSLEQALARSAADHNRQCWLGALSSLFLAWLAWLCAYALIYGAALLVETVRKGENAPFPAWLHPAFGIIALLILLGAFLARWRRRFRPLRDRPVIGWHLLPEVLLLPASLTYAIADHLSARVSLRRRTRVESARLLALIHSMKRAPLTGLGAEFPNVRALRRYLGILQILGWIDLHKGEEGFFYRVPSNREDLLNELIGARDEMADYPEDDHSA